MKNIALLLSLALLWGCASVRPMELKTLRKESVSFVIGAAHKSAVGEAMVVEERLTFFQAPVAVAEFQPPPQMGATYPAIRPGMVFKPYGALADGSVLYRSDGLKPKTSKGELVAWEYCIALDASGRPYGDAACALGLVRRWDQGPEGLLELRTLYREGSLRRELVYNGRSGDTIKVAYREYNWGAASTESSQELVYDLSESATIGFRGMRIDILEATNSGVSFIVRSPMKGAAGQEGSAAPAPAAPSPAASEI